VVLVTTKDAGVGDVRVLFKSLPAGAYSITRDGPGDEADWGHDYAVDWEFEAAPTNPQACPLHLVLSRQPSGADAWGFLFDSHGRIASRLGARNRGRFPDSCGFGTEPVAMPLERVLAITSAVIRGKVTLHYRVFLGFVTGWQGEVATDEGIELFGMVPGVVNARRWPRSYSYEPWV
jgi:hypothetical protein